VLTEEQHAASVADERVTQHEDAAHEKRNWVRLTFACNDRCVFCLDSDTHDGQMRDADEVKRQILDGRKKGATRLILSGGEPTIHPRYVDFVKLGKMAGYRKVQTVTNGRLFSYPEFLTACIDAGLNEITFSIHGPNARVHDALVGTKGAYEQEMKGLRGALASGRVIVNVDIVINRGNVKVLPEMLDGLYAEGVREFDLLQVVPFGRAFTDGKDILFYDLKDAAPYLRKALEFSRKPDVHIWLNRFPPQHLEGFEHLIQDPYKLNDEVRGRRDELTRQLEIGEKLDCRDPARCKYCYLQKLCDTLEDVQTATLSPAYEAVRVDAGWEAKQPAAFGGDPASAKKAKRGLPVVGSSTALKRTPEELAAGASLLVIEAVDLAAARAHLGSFRGVLSLALFVEDMAGVADALKDGTLEGRPVARVTVRTPDDARALLTLDAPFEIEVLLSRFTGEWLLTLPALPPRLTLRQPTYERLTEAADHDLDLPAFFVKLRAAHEAASSIPVRGVPACILGREPAPEPRTLDTTMMTAEGSLEIFRYTRRFILDHYRTKSLRCGGCAHDATCAGMHVNQVRAHGYAWMSPVLPASSAAAE
jgi:MoaA/NifB/PqqE/SkfB family radical SAM enzyme